MTNCDDIDDGDDINDHHGYDVQHSTSSYL